MKIRHVFFAKQKARGFAASFLFFLLCLGLFGYGVYAGNGVQRPRKADDGQALRNRLNQHFPAVAHAEVPSGMRLGLRFAAAQAANGTKGNQFAHL